VREKSNRFRPEDAVLGGLPIETISPDSPELDAFVTAPRVADEGKRKSNLIRSQESNFESLDMGRVRRSKVRDVDERELHHSLFFIDSRGLEPRLVLRLRLQGQTRACPSSRGGVEGNVTRYPPGYVIRRIPLARETAIVWS
jgi:hypothetical protein